MALTLNIADDYKVWDGLEPITFARTRKAGSPQLDVIDSALRGQLTTKEIAASNGAYTSLDRVWLIPATLMVAIAKPGDKVIDQDGSTWTALQVDLIALQTIYKLTTRNPVIAYDLRDLISVETPADLSAQDATGAKAAKLWKTKYANIAARVQPQDSTVVDQRGIRGMLTRYNCYVEQAVAVTNEDRVTFAGRYYEIVAIHNAERLEDLTMLELEVRP